MSHTVFTRSTSEYHAAGHVASFFHNQALGLALVAKTCPHRPQVFQKVNGQAFPKEYSIFFLVVFVNEPLAGSLRHVCKHVHAIIEDLTA